MALTGQFEVQSNAEMGFDFTNPQNAETSYTFSPSGTWTPDATNPGLEDCTAEGIASYHPAIQAGIREYCPEIEKYMKYPEKTPYALVAESKQTGVVTEVGKETTLVLKPQETLRFILNDVSWDYGNNSGSIQVKWSAIKLNNASQQSDNNSGNIQMDNLAKIPQTQSLYYGKFEVPATLERGVDFPNYCNAEIAINFAPSGKWSKGVGAPSYTAAGDDTADKSLMKYPNHTAFALLAVDKQTNAVIAEVSRAKTMAIKPGHNLNFLINDSAGEYKKNVGHITVNWSSKLLKKGQFEVPAILEQGVEFPNCSNAEIAITFTPSGEWSNGVGAAMYDAAGDAMADKSLVKYPNNTAFALLAVDKQTNAVVAEVSSATTITLKPGQTLSFKMNGAAGGNYERVGRIAVNWLV